MNYDTEKLKSDIREKLSDKRYNHSINVAESAKELAIKYGGDADKAYVAGIMHDILKEQKREEALSFFDENKMKLTLLERSTPKLWHAMAGAEYLKKNYEFDDDIISAVRYHTTGRENMTLLEKILFIADFISAERDYDGVDEMRERANISLECAMEEGLRFTINELSELCSPIHPDTVACYNETLLSKEKN